MLCNAARHGRTLGLRWPRSYLWVLSLAPGRCSELSFAESVLRTELRGKGSVQGDHGDSVAQSCLAGLKDVSFQHLHCFRRGD